MSSIYGINNSILDPNSDFYKWDKREVTDFNQMPAGDHIPNYTFNPTVIDNIYREKFAENSTFTSGDDRQESNRDICNGSSTNPAYGVLKDIQFYEPVARMFFSKNNIKLLQKEIKRTIANMTQNKFVVQEDQDESDLLITMRAIYLLEGRYLPNNINFQVKRLNLKLINYVIPDMITNIKQAYGYQQEINQPLRMIDRPMHDNVKGRQTLPSITTVWTV